MKETEAIERLRQVLRRQHKALSTEDAYVLWLRRYMKAVQKMPPGLSSEKKLEKFLTDLAQERDVAASTQNQAFNAILFFYQQVLGQTLGNVKALRATRPVHERHAPTVAETQALLQTVGNHGGYPTNLIVRMLYGCGLRVSEPLNLRIKDIDLERRRFCIRGAKGGKDRVVAIPLSLIPELTQQMRLARVVWERDRQNSMPVMLPHALARKYPAYQFSWGWAWLFPAHDICRDPRSGLIVRYRVHEANVQRAVRQAARRLGICVLPHEMRHSFASHSLERGANPRAIQQVMGHTSLETTMGYLHAEALSVPSPLDALPFPLAGIPVLPAFSNKKKAASDDVQNAARNSTQNVYVCRRVNNSAASLSDAPQIKRCTAHPSAVSKARSTDSFIEAKRTTTDSHSKTSVKSFQYCSRVGSSRGLAVPPISSSLRRQAQAPPPATSWLVPIAPTGIRSRLGCSEWSG